MTKENNHRSSCPISYALDYFGDKWTLLILRDIILHDKITFAEFSESGEGIATNILSSRLKMLIESGIIFKFPIAGKSRVGYFLTKNGMTVVPLIVELAAWGVSQGYNQHEKPLMKSLKKDRNATINDITNRLNVKYRQIQKDLKKV